MERYKRILVCIDGANDDAPMLVYAGGRSRAAESQEVHFLHLRHDTGPVLEDVPAGSPAPTELTRETLQVLVAEHFKGHGQERLVCEVIRGSPLIEILRYAHEKDVDLIMMGRRCGRRPAPRDHGLTRPPICRVRP